MTKPQKLSPGEQKNLDRLLIEAARAGRTEAVKAMLVVGAYVHAQDDDALFWAAWRGHTETVKILLAAGANVHAGDDEALRWAARNGHAETLRTLLAAGANVHAENDEALRRAAMNGHIGTVPVLARHIFAPASWQGKNRAEIEAYANALYDKIKAENPQPERLQKAGTILVDSALQCWEQIRPAPPNIQISPLPAQPRAL